MQIVERKMLEKSLNLDIVSDFLIPQSAFAEIAAASSLL